VQFVFAGLVALVLLLVGTTWLSKRAATHEAIDDARARTELLARAVIEPGIPSGFVDGEAAALDRFDRLVRQRVLSDDVLRVKVWDQDGTILYSDKTQVIGQVFPLDEDDLKVLTEGGSDAEVSDLSKPENSYERPFGELVEVYTRVIDRDGNPLLLETYFSSGQISRRTAEVIGAFRPITVASLGLFLALTVPIVWLLARQLDSSAASRERLLLAAVEASDTERRRIARDLHDGVVQDLAGTSFELSATAREVSDQPRLAAVIDGLGAGVRRSLRSLLVEIYPPELRTAGLAAALDDLLAPATAMGIDVEMQVADTSALPDEAVAIVWRVAQEAIRNATRHGRPASLSVRVVVTDAVVALTVSDDGVGFDPDLSLAAGEHFGLRGIRDLVDEAGGSLSVRSARGTGTIVQLGLPLP
jgi:signal transduction histidine kinase